MALVSESEFPYDQLVYTFFYFLLLDLVALELLNQNLLVLFHYLHDQELILLLYLLV